MAKFEITGKQIPEDVASILRDIMAAAGVESVRVTSTARTPADQARVMYENCIGTGPNQGPAKQHELYAGPGDLVVKVFENNLDKHREELIGLMERKIWELGPQTVSRHCCDPAKVCVLDISPSSIPKDRHVAFEKAVEDDKRVTKFLSPHNADPAFHLEIPRAQ